MVIIKFTVKGQTLKLDTDLREVKVTSDTLNYFKCQFNFDNSWDGFEKRAYFKNASFNITKSSLLDNSNYCYIPWEVIAHTGVILCNITGTKVVDGRTIRLTAGPVKLFLKNIINPLDIFIQKQEGTIEPDYQPDPTPTEFEQFVAKVDEEIEVIVNRLHDYNTLRHKPSIEGVTLYGDKSFSDLHLDTLTNREIDDLLADQAATPILIIDDVEFLPITNEEILAIMI